MLRGLRELEPEYDELDILEVYGNSIHSIISACKNTLKLLQLSSRVCKSHTVFKRYEHYPTQCLGSPVFSIPTLGNLSELRELTCSSSFLVSEEVSLISTITTTNIRKIVFDLLLPGHLEDRFWSSLDTELSILVDRLRESGYEHVLELEFRDRPGFAQEASNAGPDWFFPKFREKGRVNVMERASGRTLYCSDSDSQFAWMARRISRRQKLLTLR